MWQDVVVEQFEYEGDEAEDFEQLLVNKIGARYELRKVSAESVRKYLV